METIPTLIEGFTKNFDLLKSHLNDIVAASESGFGSQPIDTLSNWIVGHSLLQRKTILNQLTKISTNTSEWSTEEIKSYLSKENSNHRKSYTELLLALKDTQISLLDYLSKISQRDFDKAFTIKIGSEDNMPQNMLLKDTQVSDKNSSIKDVFFNILQKETELTRLFVEEQKKSKSTGIY